MQWLPSCALHQSHTVVGMRLGSSHCQACSPPTESFPWAPATLSKACSVLSLRSLIYPFQVKEFDTNFSYVQQSEFYLEPNMKYVFQMRCQETGKRYWQAWSSPFFHNTPERGECIYICNHIGISFNLSLFIVISTYLQIYIYYTPIYLSVCPSIYVLT